MEAGAAGDSHKQRAWIAADRALDELQLATTARARKIANANYYAALRDLYWVMLRER